MRKPFKIAIIAIVSLLVLGIVGILISNAVITSKIENFLTNSMPDSVKVEYDDIEVSTLGGKVLIIHPIITNMGETTKKLNSRLEIDTLMVDDFGYWDYFYHDNVNVGSIQFRQPKLTYYHNPAIDKKEYKYSKLEQLKRNILVKRVNVQNGELSVYNLETDSLLMKTKNFTANVMDLQLSQQTVKRRIPFLFSDYNVHFDELFYQLGDYENIMVKSSKITQNQAEFNKIKLYTKYSKQKLAQMISIERDHFDIAINSIVLEHQQFGYKNDSVFYFSSPKIVFEDPKMTLFRNKVVADDNSIKPLYSKMLRSLNFDLTLSKVILNNGDITYSEKIKPEAEIAEIHFSNLFANIDNVSNTYSSPEKTNVAIKTLFMEQAPVDIEWYFDVNDVNDHFVFKADIGKLDASKMNMFTEPNMNVQLEGELYKTYFTISGYENTSTVDLKLNYEDFKVIVMQKKEKKKNKLLSAIANIFVKKDSEEEPGQFRNGSAKVERNKTKSVFNFIWLNASQALLDAMTGKGKK